MGDDSNRYNYMKNALISEIIVPNYELMRAGYHQEYIVACLQMSMIYVSQCVCLFSLSA